MRRRGYDKYGEMDRGGTVSCRHDLLLPHPHSMVGPFRKDGRMAAWQDSQVSQELVWVPHCGSAAGAHGVAGWQGAPRAAPTPPTAGSCNAFSSTASSYPAAPLLYAARLTSTPISSLAPPLLLFTRLVPPRPLSTGISEAFIHAVMDERQLAAANGWLVAFSLVHMALSVALVKAMSSPGLVLANSCSELVCGRGSPSGGRGEGGIRKSQRERRGDGEGAGLDDFVTVLSVYGVYPHVVLQ